MRMKKRRMQNKNGKIHKHMMKKKSRVKRQNSAPGLLQLLFGVAYQDNVRGVSTLHVIVKSIRTWSIQPHCT